MDLAKASAGHGLLAAGLPRKVDGSLN